MKCTNWVVCVWNIFQTFFFSSNLHRGPMSQRLFVLALIHRRKRPFMLHRIWVRFVFIVPFYDLSIVFCFVWTFFFLLLIFLIIIIYNNVTIHRSALMVNGQNYSDHRCKDVRKDEKVMYEQQQQQQQPWTASQRVVSTYTKPIRWSIKNPSHAHCTNWIPQDRCVCVCVCAFIRVRSVCTCKRLLKRREEQEWEHDIDALCEKDE